MSEETYGGDYGMRNHQVMQVIVCVGNTGTTHYGLKYAQPAPALRLTAGRLLDTSKADEGRKT